MKIKIAIEATLKNLGLEMHHVALDSMDEIQQLTILSGLIQIQKDNISIQLMDKELKEIHLLNESKQINE